MAAKLIITFHDDTWEEIEVGGEMALYWKPTSQGLMIRQEGVRGCRTVYPWQSVRKYHVETEAGLRDQERRAAERARNETERTFARYVNRSSPVGRCGDVHVEADPGERGTEGPIAFSPE